MQGRTLTLARLIGVAVIAVAAMRLAWLSDDALITLRHALNLSNGWGPGYNATESVQGYTHPLWFLTWITIGQTGSWAVGILLVSLVFSAVAVYLALRMAKSLPRIILIAGLLLLSNAFMEFTTSGLENPLAYLLLGLLITLSVQARKTTLWAVLLGLTSAAIVLTRFDLALLIAPAVLWIAWGLRHHRKQLVAAVAAGAAPLVVWFTWSWFSYSTLLPNTFAAKQNADIPRSELIVQGFRYLWVTFEHDPASLIALLVGLGAALILGPIAARLWGIGALVYLAYVVWIGGDFMAGRFISVPVYVAAFALALVKGPQAAPPWRREGALVGALALVLLVLFASVQTGTTPSSLANPQSPRWEVDQNFNAGVADARSMSVSGGMSFKSYLDQLSLAYITPVVVPFGDGSGLARTLRDINRTAANWPVNDGSFTNPSEVGELCGFLGNVGIVVGPTVHLIDNCALTDRFLAERPFVPAEPFAWKPGHLHRAVPEGYREALLFNDPSLMADAADGFYLEQLWERIR